MRNKLLPVKHIPIPSPRFPISKRCDNCELYAGHIIIDRGVRPIQKLKLCCEDYMKFIDQESKEYLIRNCSVCSRKIKIRLYNDGHYKGGEYFGKLRRPIKTSKKPLRYSKILGKRYPILRVLKYGPEVEYWECPKCYKEE